MSRIFSTEKSDIDIPQLLHKAADKIEQLQADLKDMQQQRDGWYYCAQRYRGLLVAIGNLVRAYAP